MRHTLILLTSNARGCLRAGSTAAAKRRDTSPRWGVRNVHGQRRARRTASAARARAASSPPGPAVSVRRSGPRMPPDAGGLQLPGSSGHGRNDTAGCHPGKHQRVTPAHKCSVDQLPMDAWDAPAGAGPRARCGGRRASARARLATAAQAAAHLARQQLRLNTWP